jgi:hypothetical protein
MHEDTSSPEINENQFSYTVPKTHLFLQHQPIAIAGNLFCSDAVIVFGEKASSRFNCTLTKVPSGVNAITAI